ncbi:MAG TPA: HD domain-containing phosphohydrolase [Leptospiraceae bacterium]|nr:HD domain-containing phosphohydrolase [Leptospiraceae bacterium]HMW04619.1 HD domain-containing phosphohydrolase [Leptospiraceae bacterium]HMX31660.1 HD domain-containing phosphohydrolase [Leptospiraceae bacterium]HMY30455.1 HD domain-containing phosphohydrolase [Leptospiraceae bacterium]HMZ67043.1 HD domain-containing phosphohydrolase [Leptospiraceae bacterium]
MKVIKISDLKVGSKFTKPLYLDKDSIFINANTAVSEADIKRLNKFGFKEVLTSGELIKEDSPEIVLDTNTFPTTEHDFKLLQLKNIHLQIEKSIPSFEAVFKDSFIVMQALFRKISEDKPFDINPVRDVADKLVDHVKANNHLCYCLIQHTPSGYYLYNQVVYATLFALLIGHLLEYSRPRMIDLAISGLLADIGMAKIPSIISEKNATLTEDEFKVIKKHPLFGYQILTKVLKLKNALGLVALQHHENFDGTGYPQRIQKKEIDEFARVFTIADNFAAHILDRPWRKALLPYEAMKNMISLNTNKYDLTYIRLFLNKVAMYPVGSWVELSDASKAIVIDSNPNKPLRPSLMVVKNSNGVKIKDSTFINLSEEDKIYITKAIPSDY